MQIDARRGFCLLGNELDEVAYDATRVHRAIGSITALSGYNKGVELVYNGPHIAGAGSLSWGQVFLAAPLGARQLGPAAAVA